MSPPTLSPLPCALPGATTAAATPSQFWCRTPLPKEAPEQAARVHTPAALPPWPCPAQSAQPRLQITAPVPREPFLHTSPQHPQPASPSPFTAVPPVPLETAPAMAASPSLADRVPPMAASGTPAAGADSSPVFTDADLSEAFGPIIRQAILSFALTPEHGMSAELEPLLRATIRRALAEYNPTSRPFRPPGLLDRFFWRLLALLTSRTYEEVLFEKTHRFQVEEVYLLDRQSLALISYASNDPARHAAPRRIESTVLRLAQQVRDRQGGPVPAFGLPDRRTALTCHGELGILVAVTRGTPNELLLADLDFSLRRIEDRFRPRLKSPHQPLLQELQPFLEDCLLIQAPAAA